MMMKGDIVLGKDLKPGMAIRGIVWQHPKLIMEVDLDGTDTIYDGEPNIHFFDLNDPYYGPCSTSLEPEDEFEILHEYNSDEYQKMVIMIRKSLLDNIKSAVKFIEELETLTEELVK